MPAVAVIPVVYSTSRIMVLGQVVRGHVVVGQIRRGVDEHLVDGVDHHVLGGHIFQVDAVGLPGDFS